MNILRIKKFSTKIFAFGTLLVLLVVGFTGVKNGKFLKEVLTKQFQSAIVDQTQLFANKFQTTLTRWETKIGFFVQTVLSMPENQRLNTLKILLSSESSIRGLIIASSDDPKSILAEYFQDNREKISLNTTIGELKDHPSVVSFHPTKRDLAWMAKKINGGAQFGELIVVTVFQLSESLSSLEESSGKTQRVYLLDHNLNDIRTKKSYGKILENHTNDSRFIKNALETLNNDIGSGFLGETESEGNPTMVAYYRFAASPLRLVVHQSSEPIQRAIQGFLQEMLQWSIFFVLLAVLLAKLLVKSLLGGLGALFDATQHVSQGEFTFKVNIQSADEIGQLGQSFNTMTDKISGLMVKEKEKARLDQELATANAVQNTFFNCDPYKTPYLYIESFYKPASLCGGDWWGHFDLGDHKELVVIGDATGHGVPAALVTALAYSVAHQFVAHFRLHPTPTPDPGELLATLNDLLCQTLKGELYMSFAAIIVDPMDSCLYLANAGHPFPLVISPTQTSLDEPPTTEKPPFHAKKSHRQVRSIIPKNCNGGILGVQIESAFHCEKFPFLPGERVILYTDGLTEVYNQVGKEWGKRGLTRSLEEMSQLATQAIKDGMLQASVNFNAKGNEFGDDVTIVVLENTSKTNADDSLKQTA